MRDDPDFNIDLVQEIEKFPSLYDPTHVDYTKRNVQDKVWRELADKMGEPVEAIKSRWKNLRSRHYKVKNHSMSGAVKRKSYYLAEYLQFLDKVGEQRQAEGEFYDVRDVLRVEVDDAADLDVRRAVDSHPEVAVYREHTQLSQNTAANESETSDDDAAPIVGDRKSTTHLRNGSLADGLDVNAARSDRLVLQAQRKMTASPPNVVSLLDPDLAFMYSLVPDVRKMKTETKLKFKIKLLQLIDDTLTNQ